MTLYLLTGTDEKYYTKILPYLQTLEENSPAETYLFTIGFQVENPFYKVKYLYLPEEVFTDITTNPCVQAGEFLNYFPCNNNDIIIFTDGDMRLQRKFTEEELDLVTNLRYGEVLAGPNATHGENTLINELYGLGFNKQLYTGFEPFENEGIEWIEKTLNVGVIACTYATYKDIHFETYRLFRKYSGLTKHMARQQWFMNLAIYKLMKVKLLPFTFHSHPHNGYQEGRRFDKDGTMYINDTKVLFRHKYYV